MTLIFERQSVELIHLKTISLIDVSAWNSCELSCQIKICRLVKSNLIGLDDRSIDLSSFSNSVFLEFKFILYLLR